MQDNFVKKYGPWALVTGASAGIGKEFAHQLAAKGLNLVIIARRFERLQELAQKLRKECNIEVLPLKVDLSAEDFMQDLMPEIEDKEIGLLVNNAGFGIKGNFLENDLAKDIDLFKVNALSTIVLAHALGNKMAERKKGGIIFVSSVLGFVPAPYHTNYAASKAYNLFYGEGLHYELKPKGIDVMTLCPGLTRTEFHGVNGDRPSGSIMEVTPVVREALHKFGQKRVVVPGTLNKIFVLIFKLFPHNLILKAIANRYLKERTK